MDSTRTRRAGTAVALLAGGAVAGAVLAGAITASAETGTPTPSATTQGEAPSNPDPGDPSKPQRADETLLTGSTAAKVKAAVLKQYPGATFVRVETDSDGVYEAHITKADGTPTTVELDTSFAVTGEEQGGPGGRGGPGGDHDGDGPGAPASGESGSSA
jgi:hypothetical protein